MIDDPLYDPELDGQPPGVVSSARSRQPARGGLIARDAQPSATERLLGTCLLILIAWTVVMVFVSVLGSRPAPSMQAGVLGATLLMLLLLAAKYILKVGDPIRRFQAGPGDLVVGPGPGAIAAVAPRTKGGGEKDAAAAARPRIKVTRTKSNDLRVGIGPARDPMVLAGTGVLVLGMLSCLVPWISFGTEVLRVERDDYWTKLILIVILGALGWLLPTVLLVGRLLIELFNGEVIVIGGKSLALTTRPIGLRGAEVHAPASMRDLRYEPVKVRLLSRGPVGSRLPGLFPLSVMAPLWFRFLARFAPTLALDLPGKVVHFGNGLDEDEARRLIATIRRHFRIPEDQAKAGTPSKSRRGLGAVRVDALDSLRILAALGLIGGPMPRALRVLVVFGLLGGLLTILSCASAIDDALPSLGDGPGRNALILGKGTARGEIERADARFGGLSYRIRGGGSGTSGGGAVRFIAPMERVDIRILGLVRGQVARVDLLGPGLGLLGPSAVRGWLMLNVVTYLKDVVLILACWKCARGEPIGLRAFVAWALFTLVAESLPLIGLTGGGDVDAWMSCLYPAAVLFFLTRPNVWSYFDRNPFEGRSASGTRSGSYSEKGADEPLAGSSVGR